jgi:hypothetical protein
MPSVDVTELLVDPDFAETVQVIRRQETITDKGRVQTVNQTFNVVACVQPQSDQPMIRGPDQQNLPQLIEVISQWRLRGIAPGYQPDLVLWNGTQFVVNKVYNWGHYASGFVVAECSSMDHLDQPPNGGWNGWSSSGGGNDC